MDTLNYLDKDNVYKDNQGLRLKNAYFNFNRLRELSIYVAKSELEDEQTKKSNLIDKRLFSLSS